MRQILVALGIVAFLTVSTPIALAQADAEAAYKEAKTAFDAGQFEKARDLLIEASQTDVDNPEVFLLLGKAFYQLGFVDEAMTAWQTTLRLAPEEPHAAKMLKVLKGQKAAVDTRISLVHLLIQQRLLDAAYKEVGRLLAEKSLSDPERARAMTLKAEILLKKGLPKDAEAVVHTIMTTNAKHADAATLMLFAGQAKVRVVGEGLADGLTILKNVIAKHPDTTAAVTARLELIEFDLKQAATPEKAKALTGDMEKDVDQARCLFEWVRDRIPHSKDINSDIVTCKASEVLSEGTGICHAKSHLLAAMLRARNIPAGFCYQALRRDPPFEGMVLHGLNGIYIPSLCKWIRVDARGNTGWIDAQFSVDQEKLAFPADASCGEFIYDAIYADPVPAVVDVLSRFESRKEMWPHLPSEISQ